MLGPIENRGEQEKYGHIQEMGRTLVAGLRVVNAELTAMKIEAIQVADGVIALVLAAVFTESHA